MLISYLFRVVALDGLSFCFLCVAVSSEKRLSEAMVESWVLGYFLLLQWKAQENLWIVKAKENQNVMFTSHFREKNQSYLHRHRYANDGPKYTRHYYTTYTIEICRVLDGEYILHTFLRYAYHNQPWKRSI